MLDHIGITVTNFDKSFEFYNKILPAIGITHYMTITPEITKNGTSHAGFGKKCRMFLVLKIFKPFFWFGSGATAPVTRAHVAFTVDNRRMVDEFYRVALAAGGKDNGAPGLRPHYHKNYYAAFVLDPDGHNIEAVCHGPR